MCNTYSLTLQCQMAIRANCAVLLKPPQMGGDRFSPRFVEQPGEEAVRWEGWSDGQGRRQGAASLGSCAGF